MNDDKDKEIDKVLLNGTYLLTWILFIPLVVYQGFVTSKIALWMLNYTNDIWFFVGSVMIVKFISMTGGDYFENKEDKEKSLEIMKRLFSIFAQTSILLVFSWLMFNLFIK